MSEAKTLKNKRSGGDLARFEGTWVKINIQNLTYADTMEDLALFLLDCAKERKEQERAAKAGPQPETYTPSGDLKVWLGYNGDRHQVFVDYNYHHDEAIDRPAIEAMSKMQKWCDIMNGEA